MASYSRLLKTNHPKLRPIQKELKEFLRKNKCKLLMIEAPMGEGKTEAGLYASGIMGRTKNGILYGLPTTSTTNVMYERIKEIFELEKNYSLNLVHSTSFVHDKLYTDMVEDSKDFLSSSRTGLFIPNCISTVDQAMIGVLKVKFAILRLLSLVNKVLIIDEVHAYDYYMQGILDILLSWCNKLDIPVILLSATLSKNIKERLLKSYLDKVSVTLIENMYPLITGITLNNMIIEQPVNGSYMAKEVNFSSLTLVDGYDILCQKIEENIKLNRNIGIVCNTVKESIAVYKSISQYFSSNECILLHSKFTVEDRAKKEKYIVEKLGSNISKRSKGLIVVGTQVLEQSLDIDFDTMFSMICPIDLLLQRMGRWRRFKIDGRKEDTTFYIVYNLNDPGYEQYSCIYEPYLIEKTKLFLQEYPICYLPKDFRLAISYVYDNIDIENTSYVEMYSNNEVKMSLGKIQCINKDMGDRFQRAEIYENIKTEKVEDLDNIGTRLSKPQKKVIFLLEEDIEKYGKENLLCIKDKDLAIELLNQSFSIPYDNLPIELENSKTYIDCKWLLKGYRIYSVKRISKDIVGIDRQDIETEDAIGYIRHLYYSKKYGYQYNQEKV